MCIRDRACPLWYQPVGVFTAGNPAGSHTPHYPCVGGQWWTAFLYREAGCGVRENRRQLKSDSPLSERVRRTLSQACKGAKGDGGGTGSPQVWSLAESRWSGWRYSNISALKMQTTGQPKSICCSSMTSLPWSPSLMKPGGWYRGRTTVFLPLTAGAMISLLPVCCLLYTSWKIQRRVFSKNKQWGSVAKSCFVFFRLWNNIGI